MLCFVKEQEAKELLSSLGLKTPLSKVPLLGDILFWVYKMNKIVKNFLLAGDKCMPETHLKQPGFTYSACVLFTKNKERTEIETLLTEMILIKLVFNIIWLMVDQKI